MKVYASEGGTLALIDPAADVGALNDLLNAMWEEPARMNAGFVLTDPCGRMSAVVTVLDVANDHDGIVEVYEVGKSPRCLRIRYVSSRGEYARTDITSAAERAQRT